MIRFPPGGFIMRNPTLALLAGAAAVALCASAAHATPPVSDPRRVVCISAGNDAFLSGCEGYYRSLPPMGADSIQVGGQLLECLSLVRKGDALVVVAHGTPGDFTWATAKGGEGTTYDGYGAGTVEGGDPHPLPPNLMSTNAVTVTLVGCNSGTDPPSDTSSVTQSLLDAMDTGGGPGNTVTGYTNEVNAGMSWVVDEGTSSEQNDAAADSLERHQEWSNNPPTNRNPPSSSRQWTCSRARV
jgi:hypothetical protein